MEIKLNGLEAGIIMGVVIMEAAIALHALNKAEKATKRARDAELKAAIYDFDSFVKGLQIKDLKKDIAKLRSGCTEGES